jgi:hypothetical protein
MRSISVIIVRDIVVAAHDLAHLGLSEGRVGGALALLFVPFFKREGSGRGP